jgi:hypothetical protein
MSDTGTLVIAYTRGRKLHAARLCEGDKVLRTLCGRYGYRHPRFGINTAVGLTLSFNSGCAHCLRKLEQE